MGAFFLVLVTGLALGTILVVARFGIEQIHPVTFVATRLGVASSAFLSVYLLDHRHRPWPRNPHLWKHATVLAILGPVISMTATMTSLQYLSSGLTSILITTGPALTVLLAHVFLKDEKLNMRRSSGVILALSGALLLVVRGENGLPDLGNSDPMGYVLIALALLSGAIQTIYTRIYMRPFSSFDVASVHIFVAAIVMIVLAYLLDGFDLHGISRQGYVSLIYTALVGSSLALVLRIYTIKRFGASITSMAGYVIPITASVGGALFLGEKITLWMLIGMVIILLGIMLLNNTHFPMISHVGGVKHDR